MQTTTLVLAAVAAVAYAAPQGDAVTEDISPEGAPPAGFSTTLADKFQITAVNITTTPAKREVFSKRAAAACPTAEGSLVISLADGVLTDSLGRTGYIASNYQFQFDGPAQAGAIYTDGFSVGANGSLALGPSAVFYQCLSGGFYNLYDRHWAPQCNPILINTLPCGETSPGVATEAPDGQPAVTTAVSPPVSQIGDGQPQAPTDVPVTQIGDGQIQAPTGAPITQIGDGQIQAPTGAPITQIGDGQIQAPTGAPITQIGDGQIQAPTGGAPITQIGDGQIQAPTGVPITQIGDGQIQAPTGVPITQIGDGQIQAPTGVPITQIGDGQIQAPVETGAPITQIGDGQIQAPAPTTLASVVSGAPGGARSNSTSGVASPTSPSVIVTNAGNSLVVGSTFVVIMAGIFAALL